MCFLHRFQNLVHPKIKSQHKYARKNEIQGLYPTIFSQGQRTHRMLHGIVPCMPNWFYEKYQRKQWTTYDTTKNEYSIVFCPVGVWPLHLAIFNDSSVFSKIKPYFFFFILEQTLLGYTLRYTKKNYTNNIPQIRLFQNIFFLFYRSTESHPCL